jgi:hypothetical protein
LRYAIGVERFERQCPERPLRAADPGAGLTERRDHVERARAGEIVEGCEPTRGGQVGDHLTDDVAERGARPAAMAVRSLASPSK